MKSYAPSFIASTAFSTEPCAVRTTTAVHARHLEVGNHDGRVPAQDFFKALNAVPRRLRAVAPAGNQLRQAHQGVNFVFDDQHFGRCVHGLLYFNPDLGAKPE
jgi:hypothetical protein